MPLGTQTPARPRPGDLSSWGRWAREPQHLPRNIRLLPASTSQYTRKGLALPTAMKLLPKEPRCFRNSWSLPHDLCSLEFLFENKPANQPLKEPK